MTDSADNEGLVGLAIGVNPQGALLVQDDAGGLHTVWAGDVDAEATV
jgi:biotin-(acetyl-CoA carboxylase) ligase